VRLSAVTTRYVEALFQLALERGLLDVIEADVRRLAGEVSDPDVAAFLADASISDVEKISRLEKLLGTLNEVLADFVRLLFDKGRGDVLSETGDAFRLRLLEHRGATEGRVESARPLEPAQMDELAAAIGRELGKEVYLKNEVDPGLVGGVRVFVDNRMIDNSVQGRLDGLNRKLREARLGAG
jgi:F-type H+-transporting ATPase subunit delta